MCEEERKQYEKETGKSPIYKDQPTYEYKLWLEREELKKGILKVINEEKKQNKEEQK